MESSTLCLYCDGVCHCSEELVIDGLEPFTDYVVGVATRTRGPVGSFSGDVLVRTRGDGELLGCLESILLTYLLSSSNCHCDEHLSDTSLSI